MNAEFVDFDLEMKDMYKRTPLLNVISSSPSQIDSGVSAAQAACHIASSPTDFSRAYGIHRLVVVFSFPADLPK
jgi:hypothetical protein